MERQRLRKIQKEGSKIRKGYIEYGRDSKKRLQDQLEKLLVKSEVIQKKSSEAKGKRPWIGTYTAMICLH